VENGSVLGQYSWLFLCITAVNIQV